MRTYLSCNCRHCRAVPSKVKQEHKKEAKRKFRQATRRALSHGEEPPMNISTGYRT